MKIYKKIKQRKYTYFTLMHTKGEKVYTRRIGWAWHTDHWFEEIE